MICFATNSKTSGFDIPEISGGGTVGVNLTSLNLLEAGYLVSAKISDEEDRITYDYFDRRLEFRVRQRILDPVGVVFMPAKWQLTQD